MEAMCPVCRGERLSSYITDSKGNLEFRHLSPEEQADFDQILDSPTGEVCKVCEKSVNYATEKTVGVVTSPGISFLDCPNGYIEAMIAPMMTAILGCCEDFNGVDHWRLLKKYASAEFEEALKRILYRKRHERREEFFEAILNTLGIPDWITAPAKAKRASARYDLDADHNLEWCL